MENTAPRRRYRGPALAGILGLIAVLLGLRVIFYLNDLPRTDDAYVYADTIAVTPEVSGRIVDLKVKDNQAVHRGDLLFQIDPRGYQDTLDKAEASLVALDREIELTQRTVDAQKFAAAAAGEQEEKAKAAAKQTEDTLRRMEPLVEPGFVSPEALDQARTADRSAKAQYLSAHLDAQRAKAGILGVDALVAKRAVIQAEIEVAKLNLEYTSVRAPFDGWVIGLRTSAGQFAAAGHPVFTLSNNERWYVVANFRETELAHIQPGREATVYVLSQPSRRFKGVVESVGYGVYPDDGGAETTGLPKVPRSINWVRVNQRFPVRIRVDHPDPELFRIGASAVATMLDTDRPKDGAKP